LFRLARYLHALMSPDDVGAVLRQLTEGAGRRVPEREIRQAVNNSKAVAWIPPQREEIKMIEIKNMDILGESRGAGLPVKRERLFRALDIGYTEEALRADSPNEPRYCDPVRLLELLFPGDDTLVCLGENLPSARTNYRRFIDRRLIHPAHPLTPESERKVDALPFQFIVPSPMSALTGFTQEGRLSKRCLQNVGPRAYAVIEFDQGNRDRQAGCLKLLAEAFPLAMVVWSGSKSLHGWFNVQGAEESDVLRFYDIANVLGADMATKTPSQLARCPWGIRDNGNVQEVLYLDLGATIGGADDAQQ
tara:strand:- start:878 stop:1792 length:915 start_codon:yes stop_codon:yes gene_type:complete